MTTCARSGRCSRRRRGTFQRTVYRPGDICQFDVWRPREEVPVGHGQTRRGWVVIACLGYSRVGAGVLVFSTHTEDLLAGVGGCLKRLGGLPQTLVWDRQAGIHGHGGRPTEAFAGFCGQLRVDWRFCEPADPQAKGAVERLQGYAETNFERGRRFANEPDFQDQLDAWFARANARTHKTLRARPIDRLTDELAVMAPLPAAMPDIARRWVTRVPPDPHLRVDTNDYSLDPALVGRRVEVRVDQRGSPPSRWTPARSPAATRASSLGTARSPRWSTPARCAAAAASRPSRPSRHGPWSAMTR
jgi:hypothetical protein